MSNRNSLTLHGLTTEEVVKIMLAATEAVGTFITERMEIVSDD